LVATEDLAIADRVRSLRQYGWQKRYISSEPGMNSRLDEMQAAVLRVLLPHLHEANERRRAIAASYSQRLEESPIQAPRVREGATHVYHQYVIQSADRDRLVTELSAQQIDTAIHYPEPVHSQPGYARRLPTAQSLSNTEALAQRIMSLPMFPTLRDRQIVRVVHAIQSDLTLVAPNE
jgi:dTDP-4-amino-4,6-dideoxygalactose transaminase